MAAPPSRSDAHRRPSVLPLVLRLALLVAVLACLAPAVAAGSPVADENALPGDPAWTLPGATGRAVEGYSGQSSVAPGETLGLHVASATGARYRVVVYRLGWYGGAGARRMLCLPSCDGDVQGVARDMPAPDPATGLVAAGWPQTDAVPVGSDWVSGYYVAQLVLTTGSQAGRGFTVPFVVRRAATADPAPVLVQAAVTTWQAYNNWGGKSLYSSASTGGVAATHVSFDRPYRRGATTTQAQEVFAWEYQLVRFLEREGVDVEYTTDVDTHRDPSRLRAHRLVMTAGHDEYWTSEMRTGFEAARDEGVNIAVMGANTAYWQVRFADGERTMIGYKNSPDPHPDPALRTVRFRDTTPPRPECALFGVQYTGGIEQGDTRRDLTVEAGALTHPWVAAGGFAAGDTLPWAVGYEWDVLVPDCTPAPPTVLFRYQGSPSDAHSTVTRFPSGARVFAAGSLQVAWLLDDWVGDGWTDIPHQQDARYQAFMRAVIADLTGPSLPPDAVPAASFTVGPPAPVAGAAVTFTDTSTDDGLVVSRAWDLDDDGQFDDGTGPVATLNPAGAGTLRVRLRVTDAAGFRATAVRDVVVGGPPAGVPAGNLTANPSLEADTRGWTVFQGAAARVARADAPHGGHVALVTRTTGTSFALDDSTDSVTGAAAGTEYVATARVRAGSATSVGRVLTLRIREKSPSGSLVREIVSAPRTLTTGWQEVRATVTPQAAGNRMDVRLSHQSAVAGSAFEADLVTFAPADAPPPPPNVPPSASFSVSPVAPVAGGVVVFTDTSSDPDGVVVSREWDLDDDGGFDDGSGVQAQASFPVAGDRVVRVRVTDDDGASSVASVTVSVVEPPPNVPPSASFSVSPVAPVAGGVVVFTDTSSDPDGVVVSREWDLDDDGGFDDGSGVQAQASFPVAGDRVVRVRVTDDDGASSVASVTVAVQASPPGGVPAGNLTVNPSFETDARGWTSYQGTVARVARPDAPHGAAVAVVTQTSGTSFTLDDSADTVTNAPAGASYVITARVRAANAGAAGRPLTIRVRERNAAGGPVREVISSPVPLTGDWQTVTVTVAVQGAGNRLDVRLSLASPVAGTAFEADVVTVVPAA